MREKSNEELLNDINRLNLPKPKKSKRRHVDPIRGKENIGDNQPGPGSLLFDKKGALYRTQIPTDKNASSIRKRQEYLPFVNSCLKRKILFWSYRHGFRAVGFWEWLRGFLTRFWSGINIHVSSDLMRDLVSESGHITGDLYYYSLLDCLRDMQRQALLLLGRSDKRNSLKVRRLLEKETYPVGLRILGLFANIEREVIQDLLLLRRRYRKNEQFIPEDLYVAVFISYKIAVLFKNLNESQIRRCIRSAVIINRKSVVQEYRHMPDTRATLLEDLHYCEDSFMVLYRNIQRYTYELYPILLFFLGTFYSLETNSEEKMRKIYKFLNINSEDVFKKDFEIPSPGSGEPAQDEQKGESEDADGILRSTGADKETKDSPESGDLNELANGNMADDNQRTDESGDGPDSVEVDSGEKGDKDGQHSDKESKGEAPPDKGNAQDANFNDFYAKFKKELLEFQKLFPGSGFSHLPETYMLPYFDLFFSTTHSFPDGVRSISKEDPVCHFLILQRVIYSFLLCMDGINLEKLLERYDSKEKITALLTTWEGIDRDLLTPYIQTVHEADRRMATPEDRVLFMEKHGNSITFKINQMRKHMMKDYTGESEWLFKQLRQKNQHGFAVFKGPRLYEAVRETQTFVHSLCQDFYQRLHKSSDIRKEDFKKHLKEYKVIDFASLIVPGTIEYKPILRNLITYGENKFQKKSSSLIIELQLLFLDFFKKFVAVLDYLSHDLNSFSYHVPRELLVAGPEEEAAWRKEGENSQL